MCEPLQSKELLPLAKVSVLLKNENVNWLEDWLTINASGVGTQGFYASVKIAFTQTGEH